jgi:putative phosphoribosyl transferase
MRYEGRLEAGRVLADELGRLEVGSCVVAGIPRGGVIVAWPIAERLGAPLAALHTRKLTSPLQPEFAFGAMDEDGHAILDHRSVVSLGLGPAEVARIESEVSEEMARRRGLYPGRPLRDYLPGRTVVLVDDGLATGLTMHAAIAYAQRHGATATVVAVPCASAAAAREVEDALRRRGDRFVCPVVDSDFRAVGDYYLDFHQVADADVTELLARAPSPEPARGGRA